jgi:MOSC domain-containing protein YiiM
MPSGLPPSGSPLAALFDAPMRPGRLEWIGLRPARRETVRAVKEAELRAGRGIEGDRFRGSGGRQVTLISRAALAAIADHLGLEAVAPERLRRNLLISGINLLALKGRHFRIGGALLEWSGECHPCSRMEEELGPGGYNAVRGLGGITARIVEGGTIRRGDAVERVDDPLR